MEKRLSLSPLNCMSATIFLFQCDKFVTIAKLPKSANLLHKTAKSAKSLSIKSAALTAWRRETGEMRQETLDRRHEPEDVRQETWDRRRDIGHMRHETQDRRCETGDNRHETGERKQEKGDMRRETGGERQYPVSLMVADFITTFAIYFLCITTAFL